MVKKFLVSQAALMILASVLIILSNVVGYGMGVWESALGVFVLSLIGLAGLTFNKFLSRWVKLPSLLFVALFGLLLGSPLNPFAEKLTEIAFKVNFMAPATALGCFAGISIGKDFKEFTKQGWKYILVSVLVIAGTFFFSALIADLVLKLTHVI